MELHKVIEKYHKMFFAKQGFTATENNKLGKLNHEEKKYYFIVNFCFSL